MNQERALVKRNQVEALEHYLRQVDLEKAKNLAQAMNVRDEFELCLLQSQQGDPYRGLPAYGDALLHALALKYESGSLEERVDSAVQNTQVSRLERTGIYLKHYIGKPLGKLARPVFKYVINPLLPREVVKKIDPGLVSTSDLKSNYSRVFSPAIYDGIPFSFILPMTSTDFDVTNPFHLIHFIILGLAGSVLSLTPKFLCASITDDKDEYFIAGPLITEIPYHLLFKPLYRLGKAVTNAVTNVFANVNRDVRAEITTRENIPLLEQKKEDNV